MRKRVTYNQLWGILTRNEQRGLLIMLIGAGIVTGAYVGLVVTTFRDMSVNEYYALQFFLIGLMVFIIGYGWITETKWKADGRLKQLQEGS